MWCRAWLWGLLGVLLVSTCGEAADWPRWLGPHANGISDETGWKSSWGKDGVPVLWKTNVGIGYCTVSVAGGRLYTMGHRDGQETIYCLDAETGKEIWKHSYKAQLVDNLHQGGPAATPTIEGEDVYTLSRDGQLLALNAATGNVVWKQNLVEVVPVKLPEWGFSSSVVVDGDQLLVEAGGVAGFDRATGQLKWRAGKYKVGYGTPTIFNRGGQRFAASLNNQNVQIISLPAGQEVTTSEWITSYDTNSTTPLVRGDEIFISTGYKRGCELLRFDGQKLTQEYEEQTLANHMNNSVYFEGALYGVHGNSHNPSQCALRCIDWKTGKLKWSERGCGAGSLILSDGKLILLSDQGVLSIVKAASDRFEEISRQEVLTGECWTSPVLANGRIYCRSTAGDVVGLDVR